MPRPDDPYPKFTQTLEEEAKRLYKDIGHFPHKFFQMLKDSSGHAVAESLIRSKPSSTFLKLATMGDRRLRYTLEDIVLRPDWCGLFPNEVLLAARDRLKSVGYNFPADSWSPEKAATAAEGNAPVATASNPASARTPVTPKASDCSEPPPRVKSETYRVLRDTELARRVKAMHGYTCQICGETIKLADGSLYAEAHHVQPLGTPHNGPDVAENLLCLCPNHHVMMDYFVMPLDLAKIRTLPGLPIGARFVEYHNRQVQDGAARQA